METLADRIDAILPQTQCTKCGFDGCRPYAEAVAEGRAQINRCPPGGSAGIALLARLTGRPERPLDPECGIERPLPVAHIVESLCIGCTKCIQACPVDAIVGANKWLHTVVPELCTGCELCVAPCPVDCIEIRPTEPVRAWTSQDAAAARDRFERRRQRLSRERAENDARLARKAAAKLAAIEQEIAAAAAPGPSMAAPAPVSAGATTDTPSLASAVTAGDASPAALERKRAVIEAAIARARLRAAARGPA